MRDAFRKGTTAGLLCVGALLAGPGRGEEPGRREAPRPETAKEAPGGPAPEKEAPLTIDALPPAAQRTAREQSKGAVVRAISEERDERGRTVYEIAMVVDGRIRDIIVGADGELLVVEQELPLQALPAAVRSAVVKAVGKRKLLFVESVTRRGALVYYEAHVQAGGKEVEIKIDPGGKPLAE